MTRNARALLRRILDSQAAQDIAGAIACVALSAALAAVWMWRV